ncbi:type I polyketide synthase, partial [Candidatus Frankia alpina]
MSEHAATRPGEQSAFAAGATEDGGIAVIGMGCRLPGGVDSPASLWQLLVDRRDTIGEPPPGRWVAEEYLDPTLAARGWSVPRQAGYLADIAGFDADFFGVSRREADVLDPQHRLLEVAWEAFDHAGLPAQRLADTPTGVFIGLNSSDYAERFVGLPEELEGSLLVNGPCVASGRIAYLLGLNGPCMTVDTACSSSLVDVHLACRSLAGGECDVAIAGGVAMMLSPRASKSMVRMNMLSPTSRCHAFDAAADGFGRGEGAGLVVLKRLADARRDGDRVLAVIRGTAVNQDGRTDGLSVPSEPAQYAVAQAALSRAGVDPADVGLVEAHGTGTPVGDPIEFKALSRAYGAGTQRCALGSVKTNLGHLEPVSGVTSLIKTVLCLQHAQIPANLHFHEWNPAIADVPSRFFVPTALVDWPVRAPARVAAVSSFGFSGTNAHAVVAQAPQAAADEQATGIVSGPGGPDVVLVPAGSAEVLPAAATRLADWLAAGADPATRADPAAGADPAIGAVRDVAYTLARRRSTGRGRLGVVASSREELVAGLRAFAAGRPAPNVVTGTAIASAPRDTVWVFSGQGSQWPGMGRDLLVVEPAFAATIAEVDPLIRAETGFSVLAALRAGEELVGCDRIQPVLFAMQLGLAALWRAHGVRPAAVIGHSMGEVAAAVVAGALSVADGARVICRRSRLLTRIAGTGAMATVELDRQTVEADLAESGADREVSVAVLAAPGSTVVAGAADRIGELLAHWTARGIPAHPVAVDVASHSPQVDPLLDELATQLAGLSPRRPEIGFYSTVGDSPRTPPAFDAAYWSANLRRTVRFTDALAAAAADGHRVFVEISPNPVVTRSIADSLAGGSRTPVVLPTLRRDGDGRAQFRISLAAAHCAGVPVDWAVLYPGGTLVDVPPLVLDRRRHWIDAPLPGPCTSAVPGHRAAPAGRGTGSSAADVPPLPGPHTEVPGGALRHLWRSDVGTAAVPWLADHRVHGRVVLPGAAYCAFAL